MLEGMSRLKCPFCGGALKRNGRTSSGRQRWRLRGVLFCVVGVSGLVCVEILTGVLADFWLSSSAGLAVFGDSQPQKWGSRSVFLSGYAA